MANSLDDKIKNEYSNKNLIVADKDSFYKGSVGWGNYTSQQNYNEKIEISDTTPLYHSPVDPLRQSLGRMWGIVDKGSDFPPEPIPYFYEPSAFPTDTRIYLPSAYRSKISDMPDFIEYEDATEIWEEIFPKGSYSDSLNIPRKATRLKVKFSSGDLLQNRLSMLSLLSDIKRKNTNMAYVDPNAEDAPTLDVPDPGNLIDPANTIAQNEEIISNLEMENTKYTPVICAIENGINWDLYAPDDHLHKFWWQNDANDANFPYKLTGGLVVPGVYGKPGTPWDSEIFEVNGNYLVNEYANPNSGLKELSDKLYLKYISGNEEYMQMYVYFDYGDAEGFGIYTQGWDITYFRYISNIWEEGKLYENANNPCGTGQSWTLYSKFEWIQFITEKLMQYEDDLTVSSTDKGIGGALTGFTLPKFAEWCKQQRDKNDTIISSLTLTNQNLQANFDNYETNLQEYQFAKAEYDQAFEAWLASKALGNVDFLPADDDYNYKASILKEGIDTSFYTYALKKESLSESELEEFYEVLEPISLSFLYEAIRFSRMDMFYNFKVEDYNYTGPVSNHQNRYYTDSVFQMNLPMSPSAQARSNEPDNGGFVIDIKPEYNYYSPYYELLTEQESYTSKTTGQPLYLHETYLPNLYEVPFDEDDGTISEDTEYKVWGKFPVYSDNAKFKFENFGYNLLNCVDASMPFDRYKANVIVDQNNSNFLGKYESIRSAFPFCVNIELSDKYPGDPEKLALSGVGDRFVNFAHLFNRTGLSLALIQSWISNFFAAEFFVFTETYQFENAQTFDPVDKTKILRPEQPNTLGSLVSPSLITQKYFDPADPSPEYNTLSTESDNVSAALCVENIYKVKEKNTISQLAESQNVYESFSENNIEKYHGYQDGKEEMHREFDLNKWLDFYFNENNKNPNKVDATLGITAAQKSSSLIADPDNNIKLIDSVGKGKDNASSVNGIEFISKYVDLVDQLQMDYAGICGKPGTGGVPRLYNETLFYRILKTAVDDDGNPIAGHAQNIWIMKPDEPDGDEDFNVMKYIDTQVKYGQAYEYQVFAYQMAVK